MSVRRLAALLLLVSCQDPAPSALPLDERLPEDRARAGLIARNTELIGGEIAKGAIGDFKIYNSKIAVIISAKDRGRGFLPYGGNIVDADIIRPVGETGKSSFGEVVLGLDLAALETSDISVVQDGRDGGAAQLRVKGKVGGIPLFDALLGSLLTGSRPDLELTIDYLLEPSADHLEIKYSAKNVAENRVTAEIGLPLAAFLFSQARPFMPTFGFGSPNSGATAPYVAAFDQEVGYLYFRPETDVSVILGDAGTAVIAGIGPPMNIRAQETVTFTHHLMVGDGDVAKLLARWRSLAGQETGAVLSGTVRDGSGQPIPGAVVHFLDPQPNNPERDYLSQTRTDAQGRFSAQLPSRDYVVQASAGSIGLSDRKTVILANASEVELTVAPPGSIQYRVDDASGSPLPAKLTFLAIAAPEDRLPGRYGEPDEPGGVVLTENAIRGTGTVTLPSGRYRAHASRGAEYEVSETEVTVEPGQTSQLHLTIARVVDTTGWMSTDTHIHAQLSTDSPDRYVDKVRALVVAGVELPISTEHEWIGDFNPAIKSLELTRYLQGIVGSEVSTTTYGHFNGFPLVADPTKLGNGRIDWIGKPPAETFAAIRANPGDPFVQANHPRGTAIKGYFSTMGYDASTGKARREDFSLAFDGMEVANGCGAGQMQVEMVDWFSLLNHGHKIWGTGSTDSHQARNGKLGFPRTYVAMPTDEPSEAKLEDFRASTKAGHMIVTCGPFLTMSVDGTQIGGTLKPQNDALHVEAKVSAPSWIDVDVVEVIINGEVIKTSSVTGAAPDRFSGTLEVPTPPKDAWLVVRARGDTEHQSWPRGQESWAFTNPVFLDVDGDGTWTMTRP